MKKRDILALIKRCQSKVQTLLARENLNEKQREQLEKMQMQLAYHITYVENHIKNNDKEKLENYYNQFSALEQKLNTLVPNKNKKVKVKKVIKESEQKEQTKKKRHWLRTSLITLGVVAVIATILLTCSKCSGPKQEQPEIDDPGLEQTFKKAIGDINLDNEEELREFAEDIKEQLGETTYTTEDIMQAIRLANFHLLQNKSHFANREAVLNSTEVIGDVTTVLTSDSIIVKNVADQIHITEAELQNLLTCVAKDKLSVDMFAKAKAGEVYDVYKIADVCIKNMYNENENDFYYAKAFNELMARQGITGSITPNAPINSKYSLSGMYNANVERINKLTAGRNLGPIYGDGTEIDGTYGFICVEELTKYMELTNENNVFYTLVIDDMFVSHYNQGLTK